MPVSAEALKSAYETALATAQSPGGQRADALLRRYHQHLSTYCKGSTFNTSYLIDPDADLVANPGGHGRSYLKKFQSALRTPAFTSLLEDVALLSKSGLTSGKLLRAIESTGLMKYVVQNGVPQFYTHRFICMTFIDEFPTVCALKEIERIKMACGMKQRNNAPVLNTLMQIRADVNYELEKVGLGGQNYLADAFVAWFL